MDFVRPTRPVSLNLLAGRGHYDSVIRAVREAKTSVWIATANLKELMVEDLRWSSRRRPGRSSYRSVIEIFAELCAAGVELRILHASSPSRPFRERLERHPALFDPRQRRLEMRVCPRVHLKAVVVDGSFLYLGSANWTGAGLGAKGTGRRNFEIGIVTDDPLLLDDVQELYDRIWRGAECASCRLRSECPAPLDVRPRVRPNGPVTNLRPAAGVDSRGARRAPRP